MTLRRIATLTIGAIVTLAILYSAAWFVIADQLRTGIDRWVSDRRAEGWTARHGDIAITGFPFTWRAHVNTPHLAQSVRRPFFLWTGPAFDMSWQPWQVGIVDFRTTGTHRLGIGTTDEARAVPLSMAAANGQLSFARDGVLQTLSVRIDDASLPLRNGETLKAGRIVTALDARPPTGDVPVDQPHLKPAARLDTEITSLVLPASSRPALGRTIDTLGLRGAILGKLPAGNVNTMMSGWRDSGGTLQIDRLTLGWAALSVLADGTMALDRGLQPVGALTATVMGYDEAMNRLVASGVVKPGEALLAKFALGALSRRPANGGPPQIKVPVSVQEGWIYLGPVKLLPAPVIKWK